MLLTKIFTQLKKMSNSQRKASKIFIINGIKNLLKRDYKIESDTIDVKGEVDSTLTFQENWRIIKEKYVKPKITEDKRY